MGLAKIIGRGCGGAPATEPATDTRRRRRGWWLSKRPRNTCAPSAEKDDEIRVTRRRNTFTRLPSPAPPSDHRDLSHSHPRSTIPPSRLVTSVKPNPSTVSLPRNKRLSNLRSRSKNHSISEAAPPSLSTTTPPSTANFDGDIFNDNNSNDNNCDSNNPQIHYTPDTTLLNPFESRSEQPIELANVLQNTEKIDPPDNNSLNTSEIEIEQTRNENMSSGIPDTAQTGSSETTGTPAHPQQQSKRQEKKEKQPKEKQPQANGAQNAAPADGGAKKLSAKELKEQKKAEKQARRAAEKVERAGGAGPSTPGAQNPGHQKQASISSSPLDQGKGVTKKPTIKGNKQGMLLSDLAVEEKKQKVLPFFEHLKEDKTEIDISKIHKDVHPSIIRLMLRLRDFGVMGSTARCLQTLFALKDVIRDYKTPENVALARNLTQHLNIQITHLAWGRKLSVSQGNAIRWLKNLTIDVKPEAEEADAKRDLLDAIDNYINERLIMAQEVLARVAADKIYDGDTILTYAKSSCVEAVFREAKMQGKKFTVICVDSRPYLEGQQLAKSLSAQGIEVQYTQLHGVSNIMERVDKCFLGAHSLLANGYCYARCGTAMVAMIATEFQKPVLVCAEAIKFSEKIVLDSITMNELGPPDALVDIGAGQQGPLANHEEIPNLHLVNILYDTTPPKYITAVITETGFISSTGVPIVHRLFSEREGTLGATT